MYQREHLGLEEARIGVDAVLEELSKQPGVGACVMVVDGNGDFVYGAKTDGTYPFIVQMAFNKAYTAARMLRDTSVLKNRQNEIGITTFDWGDRKITAVDGGVCIVKPGPGHIPPGKIKGTVVGAIGFSGLTYSQDEQMAQIGAKAIIDAMGKASKKA